MSIAEAFRKEMEMMPLDVPSAPLALGETASATSACLGSWTMGLGIAVALMLGSAVLIGIAHIHANILFKKRPPGSRDGYERYADLFKHESELIVGRMGWLLTVQTVVFATHGFLRENGKTDLSEFAVLGLVLAALSHFAILAPHVCQRYWSAGMKRCAPEPGSLLDYPFLVRATSKLFWMTTDLVASAVNLSVFPLICLAWFRVP